MRSITLALLITFSGSQNQQPVNPFLSIKFDRVMICDFDSEGHDYTLLDRNGRLTDVVKKSAQLDPSTTATLVEKLGEKQSYGAVHTEGCDPHFAIVFFKADSAVASVQIGLSCNYLHTWFVIPAQQQGKAGYGKNIHYTRDGISKEFRQFINGIIKEHNFSHPIEPG
jgi:hypothetical protein